MNSWKNTENEYAVLSAPLVQKGPAHLPEGATPYSCLYEFNSDELIVNSSPLLINKLNKPFLTPSINNQFIFSKCHAEKKVPSDPQLQYLFHADNFNKFVRLWTRGYDVYTPEKIFIKHDYNTNEKGKFFHFYRINFF